MTWRSSLPMLVCLCACLGLVTPAGAVIRYVDGDAPPGGDGLSWATASDSLFTALTAAQSDDQIWVATGAYVGNFTLALDVKVYGGFAGTETELTQRDWTVNPTILDGNDSGTVVTSPAGATMTTRIDGFTITNGSASLGGGLYLEDSSPTIVNNTITGNSASDNGGGLYLYYSSPTIANNTITGNSAYRGSGLYLYYSSPTMASNTITGNSADYYGGGLYLRESSPTIANNTITGNSAGFDGGGLFLYYSSPTIANNTITGNSAGYYGGGLFMYSSSPTIANTVVAFNSSGLYRSGGTPTLRYNCVYGNTPYDYYGLDDPTGAAGNISADPLFVLNPDPGPDGLWGTEDDDFGDLQLLSGSPCIDAGDNAAVPADTFDLDGDGNTSEPLPFDLSGWSRFVDDPLTADTGGGDPPIVDLGAYEFRPGDCLVDGGMAQDGDVDHLDYAGFGSCLAGPAGELPGECECFDLDGSGQVDLADFGVFQLTFTGG